MSVVEEAPVNSAVDQVYEGQEFLYRPIPVLVPLSLGFVFLSFLAAIMAELLIVPLVGATLAFVAMRQIRNSDGNLSGRWLAMSSFVTQIALVVGFATMHAVSFATEVPPGYERVSFTSAISKKGFVTEGGQMEIHPDVKQLVNQKIMVKGYMYPTKTMDGLTSFVLCRDNAACCFGGQPKTTDMILVNMTQGNRVRFRAGMVAVAGVFHAEPTVDETGLRPVYQLDCDVFGPAKTWY